MTLRNLKSLSQTRHSEPFAAISPCCITLHRYHMSTWVPVKVRQRPWRKKKEREGPGPWWMDLARRGSSPLPHGAGDFPARQLSLQKGNSLIITSVNICLCFTVTGHHAQQSIRSKQKPLMNERLTEHRWCWGETHTPHAHAHTHARTTHTHGQRWSKPEPSSPALNQH